MSVSYLKLNKQDNQSPPKNEIKKKWTNYVNNKRVNKLQMHTSTQVQCNNNNNNREQQIIIINK